MRRILLAALFLCCPPAFAQGFSYDFLEADYIDSESEFDGIEVEGDGYRLTGSLGVTDHIALVAEFEDLDFESDFETQSWSAGLKFHTPILSTTDLVLGARYLDAEVSHPLRGTEDDTGNVLVARIRHQLSPSLELAAEAARTDVFGESDTGYSIGLSAGTQLQFVVGYGTDDESDEIFAGVQASF